MDLQVATFYRVSPEEIQEWSNSDFLDRYEFMTVQIEVDQRRINGVTDGR